MVECSAPVHWSHYPTMSDGGVVSAGAVWRGASSPFVLTPNRRVFSRSSLGMGSVRDPVPSLLGTISSGCTFSCDVRCHIL